MRSFLAPPLTLSSPLLGVTVDLGARIEKGLSDRGSFRTDPLALPENILYKKYRFSSEGIRYLIALVGTYVNNAYYYAVCLRERVEVASQS